MPRPSERTIKALFAVSRNQCAFPGCNIPMVLFSDQLTIIGEVCHITGRRRGAARYDPGQNDADRHGFGNLILLCSTHHTMIDQAEREYSVDRLLRMKAEHEQGAEVQLDIPNQVALHWAHLSVEASINFRPTFGAYADQLNISRSYVRSTVQRPDASQLFLTDESGLQHIYFLKRGHPHGWLVYVTRREDQPQVEWALKVPPDVQSENASPVDVLEMICARAGLRVSLADQQGTFIRHLTLPYLPGSRLPNPQVEDGIAGEPQFTSWAWAIRPHPVWHCEVRSLHCISFRRMQEWVR